MKDFHSIVKTLKIYLAKDKNEKIYDKEVALSLGISQMNFATLKKRNSTPYVNIIEFCHEEELCCSEIFFD
ncbi:hypothetical protein JHD48_04670 [Sulfurimonas sp. SAG-AH-194-I05]|nr:hypothetical protein [Sulfurimonas sp. SAG-AH-194-I05]MDF1875023.1 hypothetical protein [Sulfurimonas sp. SAG-AH-194-I05]